MQIHLNIRNPIVLKAKMLCEGVSIDASIERLIKDLNPSAENPDSVKISVVNGLSLNTSLHRNKNTDLSITAKIGPNNWGNIVIYYKGEELFEAKIIA